MPPTTHQDQVSSQPGDAQNPSPSGPRVGGRTAWIVTGMVTIFMMINFADKAVLGLAAVDLQKDLNLSETEYGTIASAFFILFSVSAIGVGYIADRFSTKKVLFTLSLLWGFAMLPVIGPAGFGVVLISRIILGAAEGPAFGIAQLSMQKWFDDAGRSLPSSIITLGTTLGVVISAPILAWIIAEHGWRSAFVVLAIASFIWCAVWLAIGREGPVGSSQAATSDQAKQDIDEVRLPLWKILASRSWIGCVLSSFAAYWSVSLLVAWLPPYLIKGLGYSQTTAGSLTTLPWAVSGVILLLQGFVSQRLMRRGVSSRIARGILGGGMVFAAGVCTLLFAYRSAGVLTIALVSLGFGLFGAIFAISASVCGEIAPTRQRGAVLGSYVAIYSISGVLAPYIAGVLVGDAKTAPIEGFHTVFVMSGAILIVGGLIAMLLINPTRDAAKLLGAAAPKQEASK